MSASGNGNNQNQQESEEANPCERIWRRLISELELRYALVFVPDLFGDLNRGRLRLRCVNQIDAEIRQMAIFNSERV